MITDAQQREYTLQLFGVSVGFKEWMMQTMPDQFDFSVDRNYAEYIYLRDDLITLKGKKLQAKRNHINRFKCLYPHYEYKTLEPTLIPECLKLEAEWCKANLCNEETSLQEERCSMTAALSHYEELQLQGGVLYVDGEIVAFTYGAPINHDTFDVCIEKANTSVEGAYAMINREFALRIPSQYNYINREEDMGLEGLRKAKRSYHPAILLESYRAKMKSLWRKK